MQEESRQHDSSQNELTALLASLEDRLERPVVPGEMDDWVEEVRTQFDDLNACYRPYVASSHGPQLDQIEQADPEQLGRVQQLREEDEAIAHEIDRLAGRFRATTRTADVVDTDPRRDESELEKRLKRLTSDSLALVIRIRKQEHALETWLVEAFQRDRGTAD